MYAPSSEDEEDEVDKDFELELDDVVEEQTIEEQLRAILPNLLSPPFTQLQAVAAFARAREQVTRLLLSRRAQT